MNGHARKPFDLTGALGEEGTVALVRRQLATALQYDEKEAVARLRGWLIENGYDEPRGDDGGDT